MIDEQHTAHAAVCQLAAARVVHLLPPKSPCHLLLTRTQTRASAAHTHACIRRFTGTAAVCATLTTFVAASMSRPGRVTSSNVSAYLSAYPPGSAIFPHKACASCRLPRPARSKHCGACGGCVRASQRVALRRFGSRGACSKEGCGPLLPVQLRPSTAARTRRAACALLLGTPAFAAHSSVVPPCPLPSTLPQPSPVLHRL